MSTNILETINKENGIIVFEDLPLFQKLDTNEAVEKTSTADEVTAPLAIFSHQQEDIKLFTKIDVQELARKIEVAKNEINAIKKAIDLEKSQKMALKKEIKELEIKFNHTKESLVEANLRTVFSIANKHVNKGLSFSELVAAGRLGLKKAVDTFESNTGLEIFAHCIFWIRLSIAQALVVQQRKTRATSSL